jgi:UDP-glucuronate decarboxylase
MCYVSDMVNGLMRLMETGPDVSCVNLGSDNMHRMHEIGEKIIEMTDSSSDIKFEDGLEFLTKKGKPDLSRAKEELGWLPLVRLEDGLQKTIDYTIANKEMLHSLSEK